MAKTRRLRYAVVGLGWFAQAAVLPAFDNAADNSELTALVTGDPKKADELHEKYRVPVFSYDEYDRVLADGIADAVYIALPNSMHREYTERAAAAGGHVLCEKPMADGVADCKAMIDACAAAGVRLMIAYRLHFEAANLNTVELLRSGKIGDPRVFDSVFAQQVQEGNIRLDRELGGGPVEDIGVYCINASRYLFRAEPEEVFAHAAWGKDQRFDEVPETVSVTMRFPEGRLGNFVCGFGHSKVSQYRVLGTKGEVLLDPAYTWHGDITQTVIVGDDIKEKTFKKRDQVAAELLYFSDCVLAGKEPEPSGVEGLIDLHVIEAIRTSYREGRPVKLEGLPSKLRPTAAQEIERPAGAEPELVNAASPGGS